MLEQFTDCQRLFISQGTGEFNIYFLAVIRFVNALYR